MNKKPEDITLADIYAALVLIIEKTIDKNEPNPHNLPLSTRAKHKVENKKRELFFRQQ